MVCVTSERGKVDVKARITDEVRPGVVSTPRAAIWASSVTFTTAGTSAPDDRPER